jgi:acyl-CoA thioesterase
MGDFAFDEDSRVVAAASEAAFGGDSADAATGAFTRAFTGAFTGASAGVFAAELTGRWNGTAGAVFRSAELPGWFLGQPSGRPASEFWMRFADGREADLLSLLLLVDSTAPSVLEFGAASTTIQLTVHLRAHPAPGWLACRATTRFVSSGYHEEDFEVWDSTGTLVAQSRQLALILPR